MIEFWNKNKSMYYFCIFLEDCPNFDSFLLCSIHWNLSLGYLLQNNYNNYRGTCNNNLLEKGEHTAHLSMHPKKLTTTQHRPDISKNNFWK